MLSLAIWPKPQPRILAFSTQSHITNQQRYSGFQLALCEAGIELHPDWVKIGAFNYRSGVIAAEQMLASSDHPSVIFASNDEMAAGVLAVAHQLRLQIPNQLSVVGFDDGPLASAIWPTLTTIRQPIPEMAIKAVDMLLEEIRLRRQNKTLAPLHRSLNFTLVKRESSGPLSLGD